MGILSYVKSIIRYTGGSDIDVSGNGMATAGGLPEVAENQLPEEKSQQILLINTEKELLKQELSSLKLQLKGETESQLRQQMESEVKKILSKIRELQNKAHRVTHTVLEQAATSSTPNKNSKMGNLDS